MDDKQNISRASAVIRAGGLVAFPTDTVYGIAAACRMRQAILRLYQVKLRARELPIPILVASQKQLLQIAESVPKYAQRLADKFWPGAITLVFSRNPALPSELGPDKTIGIRMPDHTFVLQLIRNVGPLAVTSANRSGDRSSTSANEVLQQLEGKFELLIDGGKTRGQDPSTVVDCTGEQPIILREGPIAEDEINNVLAS